MRCRAQWRIGLVALTLLSGCKDKQQSATEAQAAAATHAASLVEQNIRTTAPAGAKAQFRGLVVYTQALPQRMAVCGQVAPFADDTGLFVPFVSVVTLPPPGGTQYAPQFDQHIGTDPGEASRVYIALVSDCYDRGGPSAASYQGVPPTPPLPENIPESAFKPAPPAPTTAPGQPAGNATPSAGTVTMRQSANLHSEPHGPTLRVVPQGTVMHVFGQPNGGWYQVGDTAPWGWVYENMLDRH